MPSVYLETTIIGYLASRVSAQLVTAANQQLTREFWDHHRSRFDLFVSQAVIEECLAGDPEAASERSIYLNQLPTLDVDNDALALAALLVKDVPLPEKANVDAV